MRKEQQRRCSSGRWLYRLGAFNNLVILWLRLVAR